MLIVVTLPTGSFTMKLDGKEWPIPQGATLDAESQSTGGLITLRLPEDKAAMLRHIDRLKRDVAKMEVFLSGSTLPIVEAETAVSQEYRRDVGKGLECTIRFATVSLDLTTDLVSDAQ